LATVIDQKSAQYDRIFLVGHSNGGNIALRAAGLCHTKIEMVVCMSTPHVYLEMRGAAGKILHVPVYCSWETRQNVKSIVSLYAGHDDVAALLNQFDTIEKLTTLAEFALAEEFPPEGLALKKELDDAYKAGEFKDDDAIALTRSWQEHLGFPRLMDDSILAHNIGPSDMPKNFVLNVANANLRIQSLVVPGLAQHSAIHSRRMGYIIGELLRDGLTPSRIQYVADTVQPKDADQGEPIASESQQDWLQTHVEDFNQIGWRLNSIAVKLEPETARPARGGTMPPSPLLRITAGSGRGQQRLYEGAVKANSMDATWFTNFILRNDQTCRLDVAAFHGVLNTTDLGGVPLTGTDDEPVSPTSAVRRPKLPWR
jgi:hypothetical protein